MTIVRKYKRFLQEFPPFSPTLSVDENPALDNVHWLLGGKDGGSWQDVKTLNGRLQGVGSSAGFNDCVGVYRPRVLVPNKIQVDLTFYKPAGYTPGDTHEVEILVLFTISNGVAKGYEFDFGYSVDFQPIRWNGGSGDFNTTAVTTSTGAVFTPNDADRVRVVADGTGSSPVFTVSRDTGSGLVQAWTGTDTTAGKILSGLGGGAGFFGRPNGALDMSKYCCSALTVNNA
jgi:hypothetical protein